MTCQVEQENIELKEQIKIIEREKLELIEHLCEVISEKET